MNPATSTVLTLGGAAVGLAILAWHLSRWWVKGGGGGGKLSKDGGGKSRDLKALAPFGSGLAFGILAVSCAGGILGIAARWITRASNAVGDKALEGSTGTATPVVTRPGIAALSPGGAVMTLLAAVVIVALWKKISKTMRKQMAAGIWCGSTLGLAAGVAGLAGRTLVPVVNAIGNALLGQVI